MNLNSSSYTSFSVIALFTAGNDVRVPSEVVVLNSIVLPYKELGDSTKNEIVL